LEGALSFVPPREGEAVGSRVEVDVRHQDILGAEADALGCLVTPGLEPDDDASRRIFVAAGDVLREDIRWSLARRGRSGLEPGEALTVAVRREYPVGRVGFLVLAASARTVTPERAEALVIRAFIREALEWGFESMALPVSERGVGASLSAAARVLARIPGSQRPLLRRLQLLAPGTSLSGALRSGVA
jgi:hypothetical protein